MRIFPPLLVCLALATSYGAEGNKVVAPGPEPAESMEEAVERQAVEDRAAELFAAADKSWERDWKGAAERAAKEGKPILLALLATKWSPWCRRLNRHVFTDPDFLDFAAQHLVLLRADLSREEEQPQESREQQEKLQADYLLTGFPTVFLLDAKGEKLSNDLGELEASAPLWIQELAKLLKIAPPADPTPAPDQPGSDLQTNPAG